MQLSLTFLSALLGSLVITTSAFSNNALHVFNRIRDKAPVIERREPFQSFSHPRLQKRASAYLNNATQKFVVDGKNLPDVDFDIGESYAGLLPISQAANETRELFFWFFPSANPLAANEVTIWFNGGPGCSSLGGLLTENGPFLWQDGTKSPTPNPYSWVNLTNTLWVEQPVGVGYTQGVPNISDEVELGSEFIGFYKNFVDAFKLHGRKVYLTGQSYAGYYVPYIADAFINAKDKIYYNLAGVAINNPLMGDWTIQEEAAVVPYVDYWSNLFYLNESFTAAIHKRADDCGYTSYLEKYLTFPPPAGKFPLLPEPSYSNNGNCDVWYDVYLAALEINPCFNPYRITDTCPFLSTVLGILNPGDYSAPGTVFYFNRSDVQKAINAPVGTNWKECTDTNVFGEGSNNQSIQDRSLGPAQNGVFQHVIESINNTIIGGGNLDFLLPTNGTLLALQNVTWNGVQGFQSFPGTEFYTPYHPEFNGGALSGAGIVGRWGSERGLTFYQVQLAGHGLPGNAAGAVYRVLEVLLGRVSDLSQTGDFTTQTGNFTGTSTLYKRDHQLERAL